MTDFTEDNNPTAQIIDQYILHNQKRLSPRTQVEYRRDILQFSRWLGRELPSATDPEIDEYLNTIPGGKRITNRRLASLRSFYKWLENRKVIVSNPATRVEHFRIPQEIPDSLTDNELHHLFKACGGAYRDVHRSRMAHLVMSMLFYTGIRLSELLGINLADVDVENRMIKVTGKGSKQRIVRFPEELIQELRAYMMWREDVARDHAFLVDMAGERMTKGKVEYIFTRLQKLTGIKVHPHKLRHAWATRAVQRGMNLKGVQMFLGHSNLSTTSIYVHGGTEEMKDAYDRAFGNGGRNEKENEKEIEE